MTERPTIIGELHARQADQDLTDLTIALRPHLWLHWAIIAIKHEQLAWQVRSRYVEGNGFALLLALETDEALESVAAVRHCFNNLWLDWEERLEPTVTPPKDQSALRPRHFTTVRFDESAWLARVKSVVSDRDYVVHHKEASLPASPHVFYPTNVSELASLFTPERATEAVDVMLNDVLGPAIREPTKALEGFVPERVLQQLLDYRDTGGDFY